MAHVNSADPDQSSLIRVYTVCNSTKYFKKHLDKKPTLGKKVWNKCSNFLAIYCPIFLGKNEKKYCLCLLILSSVQMLNLLVLYNYGNYKYHRCADK